MGLIGKWIDSLTDEQRDRIIEHPDPTFKGDYWWSYFRDCGCLVGCVVRAERWIDDYPAAVIKSEPEFNSTIRRVGLRFPRFTRRFTPERMWRVVKARAAARNRIALPEPIPIEVP